MNSFIMAVQVVLPMTMMVGVGVLFRIFKVADGPTMKKVDNMIFKVFMPMLSFYNIYKTDFTQLKTIGYILYGAAGLLILFFLAMFLVLKLVKPVPTAASFGQAIFRSNYLIFGAAVAESIYGEGNIGFVTLLGAVAVPMYNALSVILLEKARNGNASTKKLLLAIAKNPTVVATAAGLLVNFSGIVLPDLVLGIAKDLAGAADAKQDKKHTLYSLLSHGIEPAAYKFGKCTGMVYVIVKGNVVKTCHRNESQRWERAASKL